MISDIFDSFGILITLIGSYFLYRYAIPKISEASIGEHISRIRDLNNLDDRMREMKRLRDEKYKGIKKEDLPYTAGATDEIIKHGEKEAIKLRKESLYVSKELLTSHRKWARFGLFLMVIGFSFQLAAFIFKS